MWLLKTRVPFILDEQAQHSFDALKHTLTTILLIDPLDYTWYYILYLAISTSTSGMVLAQEDDDGNEHVIY